MRFTELFAKQSHNPTIHGILRKKFMRRFEAGIRARKFKCLFVGERLKNILSTYSADAKCYRIVIINFYIFYAL